MFRIKNRILSLVLVAAVPAFAQTANQIEPRAGTSKTWVISLLGAGQAESGNVPQNPPKRDEWPQQLQHALDRESTGDFAGAERTLIASSHFDVSMRQIQLMSKEFASVRVQALIGSRLCVARVIESLASANPTPTPPSDTKRRSPVWGDSM